MAMYCQPCSPRIRDIYFTPRRALWLAFVACSGAAVFLTWQGQWSAPYVHSNINAHTEIGLAFGTLARFVPSIALSSSTQAWHDHVSSLTSTAELLDFEATKKSYNATNVTLRHSRGRRWFADPLPPIPEDCDSIVDVLYHHIEADNHAILALSIFLCLFMFLAAVCGGFVLGTYVEPRPPKYWTNRRCCPFGAASYHERVDVTQEWKDAIQKLFDCTTNSTAMTKFPGMDSSWVTHNGLKVTRVTRIEDARQWKRYAELRKAIRPSEKVFSLMPDGLMNGSKAALRSIYQTHPAMNVTKVHDEPEVARFLSSLGLDATRNEHILFHGCPMQGARDPSGQVQFETEEQSPLHAVIHQGFDDRLGSVKGMFGSGSYFADMASKADAYGGRYHEHDPYNKDAKDPKDRHGKYRDARGSEGEKACMFLARVTLGTPYQTKKSLEQLRRPPCIHGHFDLNLSWNEEVKVGQPWKDKNVEFAICDHWRFDSVVSDLEIDYDHDVLEQATFKVGAMGVTFDDNGFVLEKDQEGQARDNKRINRGAQIVKVGLEDFSKDAVERAEKGEADYEVTFKVRKSPKIYREYVTYAKQAYPEFCVEYERIKKNS